MLQQVDFCFGGTILMESFFSRGKISFTMSEETAVNGEPEAKQNGAAKKGGSALSFQLSALSSAQEFAEQKQKIFFYLKSTFFILKIFTIIG
jgi:hypothetical protein